MSLVSPVVRKLAIVDDHKLFRQGLSYILRRLANYDVVIEAASGPELLTALQTGLRPEVVLLDLHMQPMDGKEVSRHLLTHYPDLKILMLSMSYTPDFILDLVRLGVHGYLPKDIDQRLLGQAIEQVCTKGYYINDTVAQVMRDGLQIPFSPTVAASELLSELTVREREVLSLLCQGFSSADIARQLFISLRTVEGHRQHLLEKTGTNNAVSLAVFAIRNQLL